MSQARRSVFRRKLDDILSRANDEAFFVMSWATHAVQSGRENNVKGFYNYPIEAAIKEISSKYAIHPWRIETALNELLAVPKLKPSRNGPNRVLYCRSFAAMAKVINHLNGLENAEDGLTLKRINVLREIHRLTQRQFEWQRGFVNHQNFYRSAFIYGGERCKSHFYEKTGITFEEFGFICFAVFACLNDKPILDFGGGLEGLGISRHSVMRALDLISLPHLQARRAAAQLRSGGGHTSYKRSLFRSHPCIIFGDNKDRLHAPLPALIILRSTSGLFYDHIDGGDGVKNEISHRFELYCYDLAASMLPDIEVSRSKKYKYRKNDIDTPDIALMYNGNVSIILECKATRMSYEARFAEDPFNDARRGYEEMAKGVFQIWRYISHCRRGFIAEDKVSSDVKGIVLTLDTWLSMANAMQEDVLKLAQQMARERDPEIDLTDQISVIFCPIEDLEQTLSHATASSFHMAIQAMSTPKYKGWQLSGAHRDLAASEVSNKYPFEDRLSDILPWWSKFGRVDDLDL